MSNESLRAIDFDGQTYRLIWKTKQTPDRDAMAEVAKLIGMQPSPEIMQEQGHDWQTSIRRGVTGVPVIPGYAGTIRGGNGSSDVAASAYRNAAEAD